MDRAAEPHFPLPEKKLFLRETSKKKKIRALTSSCPKRGFSLNVNNSRWNLSHSVEIKVPNGCPSVGGVGRGVHIVLKDR